MKVCSSMVGADARQNIQEGHAPDGTPYPPLKRPRANSAGNDQPLNDRHFLLASCTPGGPGWTSEIGPQSMSAGSNLEYAAVHNFGHTFQFPEKVRSGGQKPWVFPGPDGHPIFTRRIKARTVVIPQRQFLGFSPQLLEDCGSAIGEYAGRLLAGGMI